MFNEAIRNEFTKAKRLANLIEEVGNHLAILFEQDNLEMEHFELSEGQTGWVYAIKLKDNDVDFSGVVEYGTCVERLVLNIYEDVWNHEVPPEPESLEEQVQNLLEDNEKLRAQNSVLSDALAMSQECIGNLTRVRNVQTCQIEILERQIQSLKKLCKDIYDIMDEKRGE